MGVSLFVQKGVTCVDVMSSAMHGCSHQGESKQTWQPNGLEMLRPVLENTAYFPFTYSQSSPFVINGFCCCWDFYFYLLPCWVLITGVQQNVIARMLQWE